MNLFIPEIGTELRLTQDWSFKLILERRNNQLIEKFYSAYRIEANYYNHIVQSIPGYESGKVLRSNLFQATIESRVPYNYNMTDTEREEYSARLRNVWIDNQLDWIAEEKLKPITLPKDTILKVDRIYIRKGKGMSDYSSITFYAQLPGVKKKMRFFAHLNDVNTIECELV